MRARLGWGMEVGLVVGRGANRTLKDDPTYTSCRTGDAASGVPWGANSQDSLAPLCDAAASQVCRPRKRGKRTQAFERRASKARRARKRKLGQGVDRRDMAKEGKQGSSLLPPTLFLLFFVVTSLPAIEYVRRSGSPLATKPKPAVQLLASSSSSSNPLMASLALSVRREGDEPEGVDRETEVEHGDLRRGSRLDWGSSLGLGRLSAL